MSANKIKVMFCDPDASNMNSVFVYSVDSDEPIGFCLAHGTKHIIHYAYPFYDLKKTAGHKLQTIGIAMMTKAILWSKHHEKQYVYLGSVHDQKSLYKLQFNGLEWWDTNHWSADIDQLKSIVSNA